MARLWLAMLLPALLCAQEFRGGIRGRVSDPSGAPVPGASIEILNTDTNVKLATASNEEGNYQVPFLMPGNYTVSVQRAGFKTLQRHGIRVSLYEQVTLDLSLEIGQAAESITVTAAAPLLNTASSELGQVVEQRMIQNVVVSLTRNVMNIRNLAPGVNGPTWSYTATRQDEFSIAGGGGTRGNNEVVADGIPNTSVSGMVVYVPTLDGVEEVKVYTTLFDAAYGHSNGGAVILSTKGGTNELHGALYLYKRWPALNANTWTNNRLGLPKASVNYRQWGYAVSGPVYLPHLYNGRNRTFFSTTLERDRDIRPVTDYVRVPTEAERKGDFSQTLNRLGGPFMLYDPATSVVQGTRATRQPFPGGVIPAARLSPMGLAVLSRYPPPNLPVPPQISFRNWGRSSTYPVGQHQISTRVDHVISDRNRLFTRLGVLERDVRGGELVYSAPVSGKSNFDFLRQLSLGVDDTLVVSPSLVGSIRLSVTSYSDWAKLGAHGADPKLLQVPDIIARNQVYGGWPNFNIGESVPGISSGLLRSREMTTSVLSTWTKLTGNHSLKFGVDYRLGRFNRFTPGANAVGTFNFDPTFTQANPFDKVSANTSGSGMASLLLGLADSGSFGYVSPTSHQNHYLGLFAQEDWKLTRRLTLNLGLRYELETPYTERFNRMSYRFDENARLPVQVPGMELKGGILFAGVGGNPRRLSADKNNLGPRVGLAWSLTRRTVIRAGYGVFYSIVSMNIGSFGGVEVFNAQTPYVGSVDGGATAFTTLADPFPQGLRQPLGSSVGLMAQVGDSLAFLNANRVNPYNQQWQFSIQRELPARALLEVAYMGMHSLKESQNFNMNEKPDAYLALGAEEVRRVPNPFYGIFPATSNLGASTTITQSQLWKRFPQFTGATMQVVPTGNALYHSLQAKVDKRLTHGLNVLWTYTFSRLMGNNTTSLVNSRFYRAVSPLDQKHVTRLAFVYELPFRFHGPGLNRLWNQVLGGWAMGGLAEYASGTPLTVTHPYGRPLRIRDPRLSGPVHERLGDRRDATGKVLNPYFDIKAFQALPNQYTISPEPPALDELRAPGTRTLNMALFKTFNVWERFKLEVRMEATGATNTPNFSAPGTNMADASTFGIITSAGGNRGIQASARIAF